MRSAWVLVSTLVLGCGEVIKHELPDAPDAPGSFKVGGALAGVAGSGVTLQLNGGDDLTLTADGAFTFPTALPAGTAYEVTIAATPICPGRTCTVQNASGTVGSADVTDVVVTCSEPKVRLVSHNSPGSSIRITDDILALANGGIAVPRVVTGPNTQIGFSNRDSVVVDPVRDLLYAATSSPVAGTNGLPQILVFENASTLTGDATPARRIQTPGLAQGLELDVARDRLFLTVNGVLAVVDNASTFDGQLETPSAVIPLETPSVLTLDHVTDRLYVGNENGFMYIFDNASQLTNNSSPRELVRLASQPVSGLAIDSCRNRLYIGFRTEVQGFNIFVFDNASGLTGSPNPFTEAQALLTVPTNQVTALALDLIGNLYFWPDLASVVHIVSEPHTLAGQRTVDPTKTIRGVVDRGYGLAVSPH